LGSVITVPSAKC